MSDASPDNPSDRNSIVRIQSTVVRITHHVDFKEWAELRSLYAAEVQVDYTSLFGGEPARQRADALIEGWRVALGPVATQHQLGPIDVALAGDRATARCQVRALHHVPRAPSGEYWEVLGHYIIGLNRGDAGWNIDAMTLKAFIQTGNPRLLAEAAELATR
jgi:hypothetical protein